MVTIQERFLRAWKVLDDYRVNNPTEMSRMIKSDELGRMWLRNEAKLWEDYVEDPVMIIECVNVDPNHPDNLSEQVWHSFRVVHN